MECHSFVVAAVFPGLTISPVIHGATQPPVGGRVAPVTIVALLPHQKGLLAALLQNDTGHPALRIELELENGPRPCEREARLRLRDEGGTGARIHEQRGAVAAERVRGRTRRELVLTHIAVQDGRGEEDRGPWRRLYSYPSGCLSGCLRGREGVHQLRHASPGRLVRQPTDAAA